MAAPTRLIRDLRAVLEQAESIAQLIEANNGNVYAPIVVENMLELDFEGLAKLLREALVHV